MAFCKHYYTWDPVITHLVREQFEEVAARRLKGMISYARTHRRKPNWIKTKLWKQMCAFWDTEEAKKRSETASKNSTSDPDGLGVRKHLGGPKSTETIRRAMCKELGREVSFGEVFIKTRKRKDGTFVDEKSRRIGEVFEQKVQSSQSELEVSMTSDGASNTAQLTVEQQNAIFMESTTKDGRGTPYGLGRLAKRLKKSQQASDAAKSSKIICLEEKLKATESKMEELKEQNSQQLAFVMQQLKELNPNLPQFQPTLQGLPAVNPQTQQPAPEANPTPEDEDEEEDGDQSEHSSEEEEEQSS